MPELFLAALDALWLWVAFDLANDAVDVSDLDLDDVVHQALADAAGLVELVFVKRGFICKWPLDEAKPIDREQSAR
jgi:hypothetical protein